METAVLENQLEACKLKSFKTCREAPLACECPMLLLCQELKTPGNGANFPYNTVHVLSPGKRMLIAKARLNIDGTNVWSQDDLKLLSSVL